MIDIFTTGGTIDKVYFDALSEFQIGPAAIPDMLRENNVLVPHRVTQLIAHFKLIVAHVFGDIRVVIGAAHHVPRLHFHHEIAVLRHQTRIDAVPAA